MLFLSRLAVLVEQLASAVRRLAGDVLHRHALPEIGLVVRRGEVGGDLQIAYELVSNSVMSLQIPSMSLSPYADIKPLFFWKFQARQIVSSLQFIPKPVLLIEVGGLPRILDMGQCNDAYSAIRVALALAEAFGCSVNELLLTLVLSWYERKAVCILLTLLSLGIKNMYLVPTLPAFLSETVEKVLVDTYGLQPITAPEQDMDAILHRG